MGVIPTLARKARVSEGLNSVESCRIPLGDDKLYEVSEGLNSVERYSLLHGTKRRIRGFRRTK